MNERFERVKEHIKKHKATYSFVAGGVLFASFTAILMRGKYSLGGYGYNQREDQLMDIGSLQANASPLFSNVINNNTTTIYDTVKPLSKIVADLDKDRWWPSQAEAARELGESPANISRHLNHGRPLSGPNSDVLLSRMGIAS